MIVSSSFLSAGDQSQGLIYLLNTAVFLSCTPSPNIAASITYVRSAPTHRCIAQHCINDLRLSIFKTNPLQTCILNNQELSPAVLPRSQLACTSRRALGSILLMVPPVAWSEITRTDVLIPISVELQLLSTGHWAPLRAVWHPKNQLCRAQSPWKEFLERMFLPSILSLSFSSLFQLPTKPDHHPSSVWCWKGSKFRDN